MARTPEFIVRRINYVEQGLCEEAEARWALYLLWLIQHQIKPRSYVAQSHNKEKFLYIVKGESDSDSEQYFGADSQLIISSKQSSYNNMIVVPDGLHVLVGRPVTAVFDSFQELRFSELPRNYYWAKHVHDYLDDLNLLPTPENINSALSISMLVRKALVGTRNVHSVIDQAVARTDPRV